ncbi:hypothetical protein CALCODRAFT_231521 [Calocera cornea HHB12733]|uniref:Uncharacterized protein n=1 Tax=Calocera cornea HHB12733 TaxID=1353952 RepID=A0A165GZW9_9BASI|nr:hypothetical protein CALCODRAFT_231521 [Calocera cornea HHB12733]
MHPVVSLCSGLGVHAKRSCANSSALIARPSEAWLSSIYTALPPAAEKQRWHWDTFAPLCSCLLAPHIPKTLIWTGTVHGYQPILFGHAPDACRLS